MIKFLICSFKYYIYIFIHHKNFYLMNFINKIVAVGNIGQLCIDLLISNLNLHKIGSLWNSMFLPICGLNPYDKNSNSLCTTGDFYVGTYNIILLQLRSPYVGNLNNFFDELIQFIQHKKICKIIILTSSYDYECINGSETKSLRYLSSDNFLLNNEKLLKILSWKRHIKNITKDSIEECYISGGGFANSFYKHLKSMEICCTILFCYCSEGDNVSDALVLFNGLNEWLNLISDIDNNSIKYPPSWEYFFGNPPSSDIY